MKTISDFFLWLLIRSKVSQKALVVIVAGVFYAVFRLQHSYSQQLLAAVILVISVSVISFIMYALNHH